MIGFLHATFIWDGDILTVYAICSFVLYLLRKLAPTWQLILGLLIFLSPAVVYGVSDATLTTFDAGEIASLTAYWTPSAEALSTEIAHYRGDYVSQVINRFQDDTPTSDALDLYFVSLLFDFFVRALGMMLVGMAFYTWGIVTAKRSDQFYKRLLASGVLVGVPLVVWGLYLNGAAGWDASYSMFVGRIPNLIATPLIASAYIALIMLWSRSTLWTSLQERLAAIGRTALTNYIAHSVIATFIFYGFGLGLFGSVNRATQLLVVVGIWALQLWLSPIWLRFFRYGPLEWAWRSLSYWQLQPLRRKPALAVNQMG
ncbi:DUF418 domain-containing protein [Chloroflexi bacterium TSY]|nr:DUF418 domain-containing protein [Chloroflexi bacterium TSY]